MAKMGRPTDYTKDLADEICSLLAEGQSMRGICREESKPCMQTVFRWLREKEDFREQYARAKEESADALVDDMLDIADNECTSPILVDGKPLTDKDGKVITVVDKDKVAHSRLRVDTRKWYASKLKPQKYSEKTITDLNLAGSVEVNIHFED